ncbi:hypothetical protein RQP46_009985 [Phenoliferia psychrophenolica]
MLQAAPRRAVSSDTTAGTKAGKLHRVRIPPTNATGAPLPFLQFLPNELLVIIFSRLERRQLLRILRTSRHFNSIAADLVAREAVIPASENKHGTTLVHLHRLDTSKLRVVHYTLPEYAWELSTYILASLTSITHITLKLGEEDWSGDAVLPKLFTDALKSLHSLVSIKLVDFIEIGDSGFTIGHFPLLRELDTGGLDLSTMLFEPNRLESLSMDPYMETSDDPYDLRPILTSATATLKSLTLIAGTEGPLPVSSSSVRDIVAMAWSGVLDGKDNVATLRALRKFLKIFPNLQNLTLTGWSEFISPNDLAGIVDDFELGLAAPLALPFGALLRTASVSTVTLRWLENQKSVRFTRERGSLGNFELELFSPI